MYVLSGGVKGGGGGAMGREVMGFGGREIKGIGGGRQG